MRQYLIAYSSVTVFDWSVVVVYLLGITLVGTWASRRVTSAASFFISDRKFGSLFMTFLQFGAGTQSDQAVSVASKTFTVGLSGIWYQWLWLPVTPFYWIIGVIIRRLRAVTFADYFEKRYNKSVAILYAVVGLLQLVASIGLMLKGSAVTIEVVSGGRLNENLAIALMTALFLVYGIAGGLSAAIITDLIQGLLTIVLSVLILPFALNEVGGLTGIRESIEEPEKMLSIVAPEGITTFYVLVLSLNALIGFVTSPMAIISGAGKTELQCRFGLVAGSLIKRLCTIAWTLTGLCAVVLYAGQDVDADQIYGMMAHDLLPVIAPGLLGLFIASMLAATMSSCDASMVCGAGLFTRNIYQPLIQPNRRDKHYIFIGRIASGVIVLVALIYAYYLESVLKGLELFWEVSALMGIAAWVGFFWKRATAAGAWAGTLTTFAVWLFMQDIDVLPWDWDFNARFASFLPGFMLNEGELYKPWHMICYLSAGLIALLAVSLMQRVDENDRTTKEVFACLRTPVRADEPESLPCTLPAGVEPAPRRLIISHPDFEIPVPSTESLLGFFGTALIVALIVVISVWIFGLGA